MTSAISGIVFRDSEIGFTYEKLELNQDPPILNSADMPIADNMRDAQKKSFEVIIFSMVFQGLNRVIDFAFATAIVIKLAAIN